jgi:hypothetical protein
MLSPAISVTAATTQISMTAFESLGHKGIDRGEEEETRPGSDPAGPERAYLADLRAP